MHGYLAGDTENGGFSADQNPMLSIGLVLFDEEGTIKDDLYIRCLPPDNSVMELPDNLIVDNLKYVNVHTGEFSEASNGALLITAGAVGVNKYVDLHKLKKGEWLTPAWHIGAVDYVEMSKQVDDFLREHDVETFTSVWHNVSYDTRFLGKYLKSEYDWSDMFCTMKALRKYNKINGLKGYALGDLRKMAGVEVHDTKKEHTALQDAYDAYHGYLKLRELGIDDSKD